VQAIASGRKRDPADVRRLLDQGPYLASGALEAGLVDALAYADELDDREPVGGTQRLEAEMYERVTVADSRPRQAVGRIALLYAVGTIASGRSETGSVVGSDTFVEWLRKVRLDDTVRAVVVRVDSPGGSAIASEVIWRELMLTRNEKPVVVSMGDVAASGGYYIAAPAHAIVAQPGTLTGSIGVVTGKFVLDGALSKIGVDTASVADGRLAQIYSPFRPFSREERARVEEQMQATYELFLSRVAEGRSVSRDRVDAVAQGRVWTGQQALERGLVDALGGLDRAIALAKERAKIDPERRVDLVIYPQKPTIYDVLANPLGSTVAAYVGAALPQPRDPRADVTRAAERLAATLSLFRRGEALLLMPNVCVR
jgi:protease-4